VDEHFGIWNCPLSSIAQNTTGLRLPVLISFFAGVGVGEGVGVGVMLGVGTGVGVAADTTGVIPADMIPSKNIINTIFFIVASLS